MLNVTSHNDKIVSVFHMCQCIPVSIYCAVLLSRTYRKMAVVPLFGEQLNCTISHHIIMAFMAWSSLLWVMYRSLDLKCQIIVTMELRFKRQLVTGEDHSLW